MEGEVLMAGFPAWLIPLMIVLFGAILGIAAWTLRLMANRLVADLDKRLARIDDVSKEVARVDADLKKLMIEMPIHYQRREDAVRETTVLLTRIDAVGTRIDQFVRREDHVRSEAVLNAKLDALALALQRLLEKQA